MANNPNDNNQIEQKRQHQCNDHLTNNICAKPTMIPIPQCTPDDTPVVDSSTNPYGVLVRTNDGREEFHWVPSPDLHIRKFLAPAFHPHFKGTGISNLLCVRHPRSEKTLTQSGWSWPGLIMRKVETGCHHQILCGGKKGASSRRGGSIGGIRNSNIATAMEPIPKPKRITDRWTETMVPMDNKDFESLKAAEFWDQFDMHLSDDEDEKSDDDKEGDSIVSVFQ